MEITVKIKVRNTNSDPIIKKLGLRQGGFMSPILFNLVLENLAREMKIKPQESINFKTQMLTY